MTDPVTPENYDPEGLERRLEQLPAEGRPAIVVLRREYAETAEHVWDALTTPARIPRWFAPIEGDLRVGGRYQVQGNASGEILACERPNRILMTWESPGQDVPPSELQLRLEPAAGGAATTLELRHSAEVPAEFWTSFGPGAVGVGWDLSFLGLALHLSNPEAEHAVEDDEAFAVSEDGIRIIEVSSAAWARASMEAGTPAEDAVAAGGRTTAFYTGRPDPDAAE
ncbi:SRPBCC domain-containing protein [Homoserinibacter sp. YIM 151385]|uniref:SRPBCC domain-containing protein n=1 Tax=Homoserinibacter sp. YIM 151385 TaxID=2985506 RepID=UPI0022F141D3|nr:SRPBCC domain-containing protein [Homoserinibacter sp. YIM 151385]WBU37559.1 SRPBCC domain-containing protein [Homoserinibacter sp. YIM 151385]